MKSVSSLIKELSKLPKGNIYEKHISGGVYYYHQYSEYGSKYSKKISKEERDRLLPLFERRKEIKKEIEAVRNKNQNPIVLGENARRLTGWVMHMDKPVAYFEEGQLVNIDEKHCPLIIKRTKSLVNWLRSRLIDDTRVNSRLLKKALNIYEKDDYLIPLYTYAASIVDRFWFKPKQSKKKYKDVIFENDIYSDLALYGDITIFPNRADRSPDLTTIGSFEKGWKLIDGEWWLYKRGKDEELFSELLSYQLSKKVGLPSAIYEYDEGFTRTKNFAENFDFESFDAFLGDNSKYDYVFKTLYDFNVFFAKEYLKIIFFDVIVNNVDRHNENIGFLRDLNTGEIISLAPNFDLNLSLVAFSTNLQMDPSKDGFISVFLDFVNSNKVVKELYKTIDLPTFSKELVEECLDNVPIKLEIEDSLVEYILKRYNYLILKLTKK